MSSKCNQELSAKPKFMSEASCSLYALKLVVIYNLLSKLSDSSYTWWALVMTAQLFSFC